MAPYSAKAIANAFLDIAARERKSLTPLKLQKLVYFAHGWYLGLFGEPLIDEQVEAWRYGPVIRSVYDEFKTFGNSPITRHATEFNFSPGDNGTGNTLRPFQLEKVPAPTDKETQKFLKRVWEVYSRYTAIQLSNLTHVQGSPWQQIWHPQLPKGTDIPKEHIQEFFRNKIQDQ